VPILDCEGVFEVVLPEGWRAWGGPDRSYDASPDQGDLGINISILDPERLQGQSPEHLVRTFARTAGLDPAGADELPVVVVTADEHPPQTRHFASFATEDRAWFVGLLLFPGGTVLATSNCSVADEEAFKTGEQIVASIAPLPERRGTRGLWRRGRR